MPNALPIGIISLGGAGRAHLRRFAANPKADVVAVFDPIDSVLRIVLADSRVDSIKLATNDLAEFLSFPGMSAVSICSPDYCHGEHALAALKHGLHVLIEKPMATTFSECQEIMEAADNYGKKVTVHHQMRFVPTFSKAKELVENNRIGTVFALEADYFHDVRKRAVKFDSWRLNPDTHQNIVFGGACHPIDLIQWIAGDEIVEVFAYANHLAFDAWPDVDTVIGLLKFRGGVLGKVTKSIGCRRPTHIPLLVLGTDGAIVNGLILGEHGANGMSHRAPATGWRRFIGRLLENRKSIRSYPFEHYEHELACRELVDRFLDSIIKDGPVPIPLIDSASTIAVCEAIVKSYQTGQPITVNR